mmetsp:Transcript_22980/g.34232  ORF Transcript_22980/g.34232 Transcript_22980/m.34232 type:complete len:107 (+) Transcript_22980:285-605(+)
MLDAGLLRCWDAGCKPLRIDKDGLPGCTEKDCSFLSRRLCHSRTYRYPMEEPFLATCAHKQMFCIHHLPLLLRAAHLTLPRPTYASHFHFHFRFKLNSLNSSTKLD